MPFGSHVHRAHLLWLRCWFLGTELSFLPSPFPAAFPCVLLQGAKPCRSCRYQAGSGGRWKQSSSSHPGWWKWWDRGKQKSSHPVLSLENLPQQQRGARGAHGIFCWSVARHGDSSRRRDQSERRFSQGHLWLIGNLFTAVYWASPGRGGKFTWSATCRDIH